MTTRPRLLPLVVLVAVAAAVVAAGCTAQASPSARPPVAHPRPPAPRPTSTTTTQPPVTPMAWAPCNGDLQCGTLVVPLDYARPGGPTIAIAVARHPAEDPAARIGSLVIDPGGPGVSGIDDMTNELDC